MAEQIKSQKMKSLSGFSKLSFAERLGVLEEQGLLTSQEVSYLERGGLADVTLAESFIENVIGWFQVPMGIATNFVIDDVERIIPMAVEETSIIAAASKTAKWIKENGSITTEILGHEIIGQIQFAIVKDFKKFEQIVNSHKTQWIELANVNVAHGLKKRGGGVTNILVRQILRDDGQSMAVLHVLMDAKNAMGANIINQVCEFLKNPVQIATNEKVTMCILSNLVDTKLTRAQVRIKVEAELGQKIQEASLFSILDPYRAATNNKGVLNGIDPLLIATGNDWRAVEAGLHAYACRDGQYRSITKWTYENGELNGVLVAPIVVGTVGGITNLHPTAKIGLSLLRVQDSDDLSRILAAVGLVQNLGALRALTTVGIIEGHMRLHIKNLAMSAGAQAQEMAPLVKKLESILLSQKRISMSHAVDALSEIRKEYAKQ
jgi:hydroxymethylglutaryl-CoA reductase